MSIMGWRCGPLALVLGLVGAVGCGGPAWALSLVPGQAGVEVSNLTGLLDGAVGTPSAVMAPGGVGGLRWSGSGSSLQQSLRAAVDGTGGLGAREQALLQTEAGFNTLEMPVLGTPGAVGWATHQVDLRLDGLLHAVSSAGGDGISTAGVDLRYALYNLDSSAYLNDGYPIFSFHLYAELRHDVGASGGSSTRYTAIASAELLPGTVDHEAWDWAGNTVGAPVAHGSTVALDTGLLSFMLDSFIDPGDRLVARATLATTGYGWAGSGGSWQAASDFSHTFDVELAPLDTGLGLGNYAPGVFAPVPEPGGALLLLAGLACVAGLRHRPSC